MLLPPSAGVIMQVCFRSLLLRPPRPMNNPPFLTALLARLSALAAGLPSTATAQEARLLDLSTTSQVGSGTNVLTVGFVITGTSNKTVLVRGIGPGLSQFKITGTVATPTLTLFSAN